MLEGLLLIVLTVAVAALVWRDRTWELIPGLRPSGGEEDALARLMEAVNALRTDLDALRADVDEAEAFAEDLEYELAQDDERIVDLESHVEDEVNALWTALGITRGNFVHGEDTPLADRIHDLPGEERLRTMARYLRSLIETGTPAPDRGAVAFYVQPEDDSRVLSRAAADFRDAIGGKFGSARPSDQDDRPPVNYDERLGFVWVPVSAAGSLPEEAAGLRLADVREMFDLVTISTGTSTRLGDRAIGDEQWDGDLAGT